MRVTLKRTAVLFAVSAAMAVVAATAEAAEPTPAEGVRISWEGQGEIQLAPDDDGEFSLSLRLSGKVVVRGEGLEMRADRLVYNRAKETACLESTDRGGVRLLLQLPDDGPTLQCTARKILVSLRDGRIKVDGCGTLSTPAETLPRQALPGGLPRGEVDSTCKSARCGVCPAANGIRRAIKPWTAAGNVTAAGTGAVGAQPERIE